MQLQRLTDQNPWEGWIWVKGAGLGLAAQLAQNSPAAERAARRNFPQAGPKELR